jgi:hypothetical protein
VLEIEKRLGRKPLGHEVVKQHASSKVSPR